MQQLVSVLVTSLLVTPFSLLVQMPAAIAHQRLQVSSVRITTHLEPDDSPFAGRRSLAWFHLTNSAGETIPLAECRCNLMVYDWQNQVIDHSPLAEVDVEGHERPIGTYITFPGAGQYRLVLTGSSMTGNFQPFELTLPVTVRPQVGGL